MSHMHFRAPKESLAIEIRPRCPKCKKEFILFLNNYLPGKYHACYACGTVTPFSAQLAEKLQRQMDDLEESIREIFENFSSD
jgi:hypothetical protein